VTDWGCYVMAPWAGRIREGCFQLQNQTYRVPLRQPPHALHGTVLDARWKQVGPQSLESEFGLAWPWKGKIRSDFELSTTALQWKLSVSTYDFDMPITLGWHPWFRRAIGPEGEAFYTFAAGKKYIRDQHGIPTGEMTAIIGEGPFDDCFTSLSEAPRISWPCGLTMRLSSSCNYWVVYDQPAHAFCLEPQSGPPDGFNLGEFEFVSPEKPLVHSFCLDWGSD